MAIIEDRRRAYGCLLARMDRMGSFVYADPCRVANWRDAALPIRQNSVRVCWLCLLYLHTNGNNGMSDSRSIRGLGDVVHTVIKAVGLDRLAPKGCGCSKRRHWLNNLGKKSSVSEDLTDTEAQPLKRSADNQ